MERAYHVMLKAALPILGRDTGKRASIAREETVGILGDHWLESVGQAPRRQMTAAGQKKRQRHNEKIKSLKRSKDSAPYLLDDVRRETPVSALMADVGAYLKKHGCACAEAGAGEVDALKKAKAVLNGADYSFAQVSSRAFLAPH